ncbi:hypothetical protein B0H65DRAFT_392266, partial [Neurospora tetraspora]
KPVKIKHTKEYTHEDCPGPGWNFKTVFCLKTLYVHHKMKKTANGFSKRGCFKCVHFQKDEEAKKRGEEGCSGCMWPKCPRYHPGLYFSEI